MQEKVFETYPQALAYFQENYDKLEDGHTMGIDARDGITVRVHPPVKHEKVVAPSTWGKTWFTSDGMDAVVNHADGKTYDSRSNYYKSLKQTGNHIVEAGETYKPADPMSDKGYKSDLKKDIASTINQLKQGRR
jgi:hypothetical protein